MNIFKRIAKLMHDEETTLGNPLGDELAIKRRQTHFASLTGGRGFRQPPKSTREAKKDAQGLTRRDRREKRFRMAFLGATK